MSRKNNRADHKQERHQKLNRVLKRNKVAADSLTYCTYERSKSRLKLGGFTNSSPKLTKVRFSTRKDAQRLLTKLKSEGREESRIYKCHICKGYHLTKQRKMGEQDTN